MARPKTNPDQQRRAYELWATRHFTNREIMDQLTVEFDTEAVQLRTVERWVHGFKKAETDMRAMLDGAIEWHRFEDYGLPWEASPFLFEMCYYVVRQEPFPSGKLELVPTVRQLRWWWRVHLALPTVDKFDVYHLAQRFVAREIMHEALGEELNMADLDAQLIFRPWESDERRSAYQAAIDTGAISRLRDFDRIADDVAKMRALAAPEALTRHVDIQQHTDLHPDYPHMLPSQQFMMPDGWCPDDNFYQWLQYWRELISVHRGQGDEKMNGSIRKGATVAGS